MRNPWVHDVDEGSTDRRSDVGTRRAVRLGVALWLLVGVAAVGLYLGWSVAPRQHDGAGPVEGPTFVFRAEGGAITVLVPVGGRQFGFVVDGGAPRLDIVVAGRPIEVISPAEAGP